MMTRRRTLRRLPVLTCLALLAAALVPVHSRAANPKDGGNEGWKKFQVEVRLDDPTGSGTFKLRRSEGGFTQLRLHIEGASAVFNSLTIRYEDGGEEHFTMKRYVRSGKNTPAFQLPNPDRVVRRVFFDYEVKQADDGNPKQIVSLWTK